MAPAARKSKCLEEGVDHEMKNCRTPGADAQSKEHVADLAHRGISENALDIVLVEGGEGGNEQGDAADDRDGQLHAGRQSEEHMCPRDQVDAGGDHGSGMDERADGGGAGHSVGQPGLQRNLGGFADRADEQQRGGQRCAAWSPAARPGWRAASAAGSPACQVG